MAKHVIDVYDIVAKYLSVDVDSEKRKLKRKSVIIFLINKFSPDTSPSLVYILQQCPEEIIDFWHLQRRQFEKIWAITFHSVVFV